MPELGLHTAVNKPLVVIASTNKWFSAVNEYAMQMALSLDKECFVTVLTHRDSPLPAKIACASNSRIVFGELPLLPAGVFSHVRSFWQLHRLLRCYRNVDNNVDNSEKPRQTELLAKSDQGNEPLRDMPTEQRLGYFFVFEGREHVLCWVHRWLFPRLWAGWVLVRVRGQAALVKDSWINFRQYRRGCDVLVCAAEVVAGRIPFFLKLPNSLVFHFCSSFKETKDALNKESNHTDGFFEIPQPHRPNAAVPIRIVLLGRFDPVKGHFLVVDALAELISEGHVTRDFEVLFIGRSENISLIELCSYIEKKLTTQKKQLFDNNTRGYRISSTCGKLSFFVSDRRVSDLANVFEFCDFGLIASLDSEVICRVAVEFMKSGLPVLSSCAGALPEVIFPEAGIFFETANKDSLKVKIMEAVQKFCPHKTRHNLADGTEIGSKQEKVKIMRNSLAQKALDVYGSQNYFNLLKKIEHRIIEQ